MENESHGGMTRMTETFGAPGMAARGAPPNAMIGGGGESAGFAVGRRVLLGVVIALVLIVLYFTVRTVIDRLDRFTIERTTALRSAVDGLPYRVHPTHTSPQKAADLLAAINGRLVIVMRRLRTKYARDPEMAARFPARARATARILRRYNPDNLVENSPLDPSGDTSYTVDKGTLLALCLRARDRGGKTDGFHDMDLLTFVALHELSHIAIEEIDHPPGFWKAFKFILEESVQAGVYKPEDYRGRPITYCGLVVDYQPLFDSGLEAIV